MLILDTEVENTSECPAVRELLRSWVAQLWAWWRRQPQPRIEPEESKNGQDRGTGLIL